MLVAALYDIHGNAAALEAVLREIRKLGVDRVVVGGDVVPGPLARETLEMLSALDVRVDFVYGNGEVAVLEEMAGRPAKVPEQVRPMIRWTAEELKDYEEMFRAWPKTLEMEIEGLGRVMFCHGTPRDENEIFTLETPEEELRGIFAGVQADVVVCGHTHMQFGRMIGRVRVVNAGSVGMPFGVAGADWLLLGEGAGGGGVELRHTNYDLQRAAEKIQATSFPGAAHFAEHSVMHPPSEEMMLKAYARKR